MKVKIAIYGGTDLPPELIAFVTSLTTHLISFPEVVLVSAGFDYYLDYPDHKSVDRIVLDTARKCITKDFENRFETWFPKDENKRNVKRFREGYVIEVRGSTQARRFNVVQNIDALVTIKGKSNTGSVIELALAINKPVLPVAFTGGDSKLKWDEYEEDIVTMLKMPDDLNKKLKAMPAPADMEETAKQIAGFIKEAVKKKCLVLMPFKESDDHFYDAYIKPAIENSNYIDHRIDRNDPSGNIPLLFKMGVEKCRAVIVDITGYNINVLYELGYVHAKGMAPLIIQRIPVGQSFDDPDLPFYLRTEMIYRQYDNEQGYKNIQDKISFFLKDQN